MHYTCLRMTAQMRINHVHIYKQNYGLTWFNASLFFITIQLNLNVSHFIRYTCASKEDAEQDITDTLLVCAIKVQDDRLCHSDFTCKLKDVNSIPKNTSERIVSNYVYIQIGKELSEKGE